MGTAEGERRDLLAMGPSDKLKVLATLSLPDQIGARLSERCEVTLASSREELLERISGQQVLLCTSFDTVDRELVEAGQALSAVVTVSAGYNHVDTEILRRRGVGLANTPAVLTDSV